MAIGQLYSAGNAVVGQAAVFLAPPNTALPVYSATSFPNMATDPFDPTPWVQTKLQASATLSAGTYVLTYTYNGTAYPVASQTVTTGTATALDTAITTALAAFPGGGPTAAEVIVTGGPASATATPLQIVLSDRLLGGVWTIVPTGITGGTLNLTNAIWTPVGATDQGWTLASTASTQSLYIEEQSTPIAVTMNTRNVTVQGALAESINRTLNIVHNGVGSVTAPGVGQAGFARTTLSDIVQQYALALVSSTALGFPHIDYAPVWVAVSGSSTAFRRANKNRIYPITFSTVCATGSITMDEFFAAGT